MLSFENFVKSMPPSLSELKVTSSFCFAFKIPDDVAVTSKDEPSKQLSCSPHTLMKKRILNFHDFFSQSDFGVVPKPVSSVISDSMHSVLEQI